MTCLAQNFTSPPKDNPDRSTCNFVADIRYKQCLSVRNSAHPAAKAAKDEAILVACERHSHYDFTPRDQEKLDAMILPLFS